MSDSEIYKDLISVNNTLNTGLCIAGLDNMFAIVRCAQVITTIIEEFEKRTKKEGG